MLEKLEKILEPLKKKYLEEIERWSISEYNKMVTRNTWTEHKWNTYALSKVNINSNTFKVYSLSNYDVIETLKREKEQVERILSIDSEIFIKRNIREARIQYNSFFDYLLLRLKNINTENITLDVNDNKYKLILLTFDSKMIFDIILITFFTKPYFRYTFKKLPI